MPIAPRRRWLALIAAVAVLPASGFAEGGASPYRDLSGAGSGFLGAGREIPDPDTLASIRIGVTGPARTPAGRELLAGVQLAIDEANAAGGYHGVPFEIYFRPNDGPWGVVASQVVRLAAEDDVWVIIGALDGERAHAAELVVAKLWVPVITPAGDHTIDYANVPWVFRCMADDLSQVEALLDLALDRGWRRLVLISEIWRDAEQAAGRFRRRAAERGLELVLHHRYESYRPLQALQRLVALDIDAAVVWGRPFCALPVLRRLRDLGLDQPLLLPSLLAVPEVAQLELLGQVMAVAPYDLGSSRPDLEAFRRRWTDGGNEKPSHVGVLAYDMTRFALAAMDRAGLNRVRLREELASGGFDGLTGPFRFNSLGGRLQDPVAVTVRDGRWVSP